jgi:hypothetical protein
LAADVVTDAAGADAEADAVTDADAGAGAPIMATAPMAPTTTAVRMIFIWFPPLISRRGETIRRRGMAEVCPNQTTRSALVGR